MIRIVSDEQVTDEQVIGWKRMDTLYLAGMKNKLGLGGGDGYIENTRILFYGSMENAYALELNLDAVTTL